MSRERYTSVVNALCAMHKLDPEPVLQGRPLEVCGIAFLLRHSEAVDPAALMVYCDFGAVPDHLQAQAYRSLLETNLSLHTGAGPGFAISPSTGHVVQVDNYRLEGLTPQVLSFLLAATARQAQAWRNGYFFDEAQKPPKPNHTAWATLATSISSVPRRTGI